MKKIGILLLLFCLYGCSQEPTIKEEGVQTETVSNKSATFTQVIFIKLDETGKGLLFDDGKNKGGNITTLVSVGSVVKWKLVPNSDIESLDAIKEKDINIFSIRPGKQPDGSLQGIVGFYPNGTTESYGVYILLLMVNSICTTLKL